MTCIVGVEKDGHVWIGGDSAGVNGSLNIHTRRDEKVFKKEEFVMGFTTSFRMGQLLRYEFEPPDHSSKKDEMGYLVGPFVDAMRECFRASGYLQREDTLQEYGGTFLLGYRGKLYQICDDFQIAHTFDGYAAVGCGQDVALGSLYATRDEHDPVKRLTAALEAAAHFSAGVRAPFNIVTTKEG